MPNNLFFVYGTLKVGGHFNKIVKEFLKSYQPAKLRGYVLYNFGSFPGIIKGKGVVDGELHEYTNVDVIMSMIDRIEGYRADNEDDSLFLRREVEIELSDTTNTVANVYIFNRVPFVECKCKTGKWEI